MGNKYWLTIDDFIARKKQGISKRKGQNKKKLSNFNPEKIDNEEQAEPALDYIVEPISSKR